MYRFYTIGRDCVGFNLIQIGRGFDPLMLSVFAHSKSIEQPLIVDCVGRNQLFVKYWIFAYSKIYTLSRCCDKITNLHTYKYNWIIINKLFQKLVPCTDQYLFKSDLPIYILILRQNILYVGIMCLMKVIEQKN